ncbi:MAG: hypothetical protein IJJ44_03765 [Solobacterium sp.]|nr:hypothetical protein [Solobacterium sp.]
MNKRELINELFHSLYDAFRAMSEIMSDIYAYREDIENISDEQIQTAIEAAERINADIYVISKLLGKKSPKFNFDQFKK